MVQIISIALITVAMAASGVLSLPSIGKRAPSSNPYTYTSEVGGLELKGFCLGVPSEGNIRSFCTDLINKEDSELSGTSFRKSYLGGYVALEVNAKKCTVNCTPKSVDACFQAFVGIGSGLTGSAPGTTNMCLINRNVSNGLSISSVGWYAPTPP